MDDRDSKKAKISPLYDYQKKHSGYEPQWKLRYDPDGNFRAYYNPKFGRIYVAVVEEGGETYDQPVIEEAKMGLVICPYCKREGNVLIGLSRMSRPVAGLDISLELPRCFGEPGKDSLQMAREKLQEEAGRMEIIDAEEGPKMFFNTTFFKTPAQIIFVEVELPEVSCENFCFYGYPEEIDSLKKEGEIRCAITLAALSLFDRLPEKG